MNALTPLVHSLATFRYLRQLPPIDAAFATIGEQYDRAFAVAEAAERRMSELQPPASYSDAVEEVITSGQLPEDFGAWVLRHTSPKAQFDAERQALQGLRNQAANVCAHVISSRMPHILGHLHSQLTEVIDRARPAAATLGPITEAEAVMRAGAEAIAAFGVLDQCWTEYGQIREAQRRLMSQQFFDQAAQTSCRSDRCDDAAASDAYFRNLDELHPDWRTYPGQSSTRFLDGTRPSVPWPDQGPMQLKWFIDHDAEFWVPTEQQISQLHRGRAQRNSELAYEIALTPEQRERYEKTKQKRQAAQTSELEWDRSKGEAPKPGPESAARRHAQRSTRIPA